MENSDDPGCREGISDMETTLYQWQEECLGRWLESGGHGMVQAVTGSGKTRLALGAIDALEQKLGHRVLVKIVVPTSSLMRQWARALREHLEAATPAQAGMPNQADTLNQASTLNQAGMPNQTDIPNPLADLLLKNDSAMEKDALTQSRKGLEEPDFPVKPPEIKEKIGQRGGGRKDSANCRYMIYVINSARYELARQILVQLKAGETVMLIADECHHYASGENHLIFEYQDRIDQTCATCYTLGLSATLPSGQAGRTLAGALGPRIYTYGMAKASAMKTICPFDIFHISLRFQEEELEEYETLTTELAYCYGKLRQKLPYLGKLNLKELFEELKRLSAGKDRGLAKLASTYMNLTYLRRRLVCLASTRISCAGDLIRRLDEKDKILVFGERIDQAEELYDLLNRVYPGQVGRCHSKMGELANRNNLERFRTGEFRILITCKSLDEGVDIPDASIGIILSGTSVQRQRTQRLGRIIRKKEGKERASLYYLHIEESSEDNVYLPDVWETHTFELSYRNQPDHSQPRADHLRLHPDSLQPRSDHLRLHPDSLQPRSDHFLPRPDLSQPWPGGLQYHRPFTHLAYDEAADLVFCEMKRQGADERVLQEALRCLDMGSVRGDWMSDLEFVEKRIREAPGREERNYWVCMKRVGRYARMMQP
ncbi:MAG: DEAD/DEAH box helicase family protein [Lachnospiraceae bacterium]|nr:DEAD/DEAH box helicase family protein [Lachnospiraceae bacterium]